MQDLIDSQHGTYDVDKVIEQLEERKKYLLKDFVLAEKAETVKEITIARINELMELLKLSSAERYAEFENLTELSEKIEWKLWAARHPREQMRKQSMTELLFCMLRSRN